MEVLGSKALTAGQRNVHEIDRSVTERRIGQSQPAGALQQPEVGLAIVDSYEAFLLPLSVGSEIGALN